MVTHVVLFKFGNEPAALEAKARLLGLRGHIPGMSSLEVGLDINRSDVAFDLALITRHDSRQALADYQSHSLHEEVVTFIRGVATARAVVDFE